MAMVKSLPGVDSQHNSFQKNEMKAHNSWEKVKLYDFCYKTQNQELIDSDSIPDL